MANVSSTNNIILKSMKLWPDQTLIGYFKDEECSNNSVLSIFPKNELTNYLSATTYPLVKSVYGTLYPKDKRLVVRNRIIIRKRLRVEIKIWRNQCITRLKRYKHLYCVIRLKVTLPTTHCRYQRLTDSCTGPVLPRHLTLQAKTLRQRSLR